MLIYSYELEKYIFSKEKNINLNVQLIYCLMRLLHG